MVKAYPLIQNFWCTLKSHITLSSNGQKWFELLTYAWTLTFHIKRISENKTQTDGHWDEKTMMPECYKSKGTY